MHVLLYRWTWAECYDVISATKTRIAGRDHVPETSRWYSTSSLLRWFRYGIDMMKRRGMPGHQDNDGLSDHDSDEIG
jgi:hypothetical protein